MAADLAELKRQLPVLVQLLQIRGLVPVTTASKSEQDDLREKEPSSDRPRGLDHSTSPHEPDPEPKPELKPKPEPEAEPEPEPEPEPESEPQPEPELEPEPDPEGSLHNQHSTATSLTYEAYMFTGEVEKSYLLERILISERELTELAAESQSPSALSALARLPAGHRTAVNKLLKGREDEKGSILGLMPIKGKKPWWTRLTPRRHKDRYPQVAVLLQFEQDSERGYRVMGRRWSSGPPMHRQRIVEGELLMSPPPPQEDDITEVIEDSPVRRPSRRESKRTSGAPQEYDLDRIIDQGTPAHDSDIITDREREEQRPIRDRKSARQETLPSQAEAEKLMDTYLADFTTFSNNGDEGDEGA
jgi:outer membrane biosynthesis protein TonB